MTNTKQVNLSVYQPDTEFCFYTPPNAEISDLLNRKFPLTLTQRGWKYKLDIIESHVSCSDNIEVTVRTVGSGTKIKPKDSSERINIGLTDSAGKVITLLDSSPDDEELYFSPRTDCKVEKFIKDGEVAVLVSNGYGAGFYSWNDKVEAMLFSPYIVDIILNDKDRSTINDYCIIHYGVSLALANRGKIPGSIKNLYVAWVPVGEFFVLVEDDGFESITTKDDDNVFIA